MRIKKMLTKRNIIIIVFLIGILAAALGLNYFSTWRQFSYNGYSFYYNQNIYKLNFTEPTQNGDPKWNVKRGTLTLESQDLTITFTLQDNRFPDSNAFTWVGESLENTLKNNSVEKVGISEDNYLVCHSISKLYCSIKNNIDNVLYPSEFSILGYNKTQVSIQFDDVNTKNNRFSEMNNIINSIISAKKD